MYSRRLVVENCQESQDFVKNPCRPRAMNEIAEWGPSDHCRLMIEVKDNARVAVPKESRAARFIQPTSGVEVIYADARGEATLNAPIARTTEYWWSENQPDARSLWESKIELGEDFSTKSSPTRSRST